MSICLRQFKSIYITLKNRITNYQQWIVSLEELVIDHHFRSIGPITEETKKIKSFKNMKANTTDSGTEIIFKPQWEKKQILKDQ